MQYRITKKKNKCHVKLDKWCIFSVRLRYKKNAQVKFEKITRIYT